MAIKMARQIGYSVGGPIGTVIAVFATTAPSLILMILLLAILYRYKDSLKVNSMTLFVRPVTAIMVVILTCKLLISNYFFIILCTIK